LTALELLAALQHYGVPTRMLDFTFNPLIALWFAVEDTNGAPSAGRIFAIDIAERIVQRDLWIKAEPWWNDIDPGALGEWTTQVWVWRPPPMEPRIVRQEACFLNGRRSLNGPSKILANVQ
jgi:hypothetical protein